MNRATSLYLDAVRLLAALIVVLTHLAYKRFSGGMIGELRGYGNDAVMVFFVLSGYVIAYTAATKERDLSSYTINRLARLYSVALPALVVTVLLDQSGRLLAPEMYRGFWYKDEDPLWRLLTAATFTNELWLHSWRYFSNGPYWSLGYEFWYYVLFAAGFFFRGRTRYLSILVLSLFIGPKILLLFPIWLLGVAVYRFNNRRTLSERIGICLFLGSIGLYAAFRLAGLREAWLDWTYDLLGRSFVRKKMLWSDEFVSSYFIGLCVAMNFVGFHAISERVEKWFKPVEGVIRWSAAFTFSIYLFHYPLMQFFAALLRIDPDAPAQILLLLTLTLATSVAFGRLTERKKSTLKQLLVKAQQAIVGKTRKRGRMTASMQPVFRGSGRYRSER